MVSERTTKTEVGSTVAVYSRYYLGEVFALNRALDSVFTVWGGAPLQILSVVDVRPR